MEIGSIVEYIGGQDEAGKKDYKLALGDLFIISGIFEGIFVDGVKIAFTFEEVPKFYFLTTMFKEVSPPLSISVEQLLEEKIKF